MDTNLVKNWIVTRATKYEILFDQSLSEIVDNHFERLARILLFNITFDDVEM